MWWKKSLLSKVIVGMLISAVIPLFVSIAISYQTTTGTVRSQVIDLNQRAMDSSIYYLKRYLDDLSHVSVSFYYDSTLMDDLRTKGSMDYNKRLYISNQVYTISKVRPEFRAARFVSHTGDIFTNTSSFQLETDSYLKEGSTPENDPAGWTESHGYDVVAASGEKLLAFHQPITDYPRPNVLGVLSIYVGPEVFERLIRPFSDTSTSAAERVDLMIRGDHKLLYSTAAEQADDLPLQIGGGITGGRGYRKAELNGQEGVMIYVTDEFKGIPLTLVKFVPSTVVNVAANQALRKSLVIPFLTTVIVLVCAFVLTYKLIAPIKRLVRNIAKVESGNFDMQPVPARQDELGVLEHRFQSMVKGLDDLMNREYRSRLELTTARLKMLQAQINPHFLYNSLQSIGTLALRHGVSEINDKIAELGSIMRYSMDISTETVPLRKEIEHIKHYLSLQTGRFKNRLSYTLSCPEEAMHIPVPKMILQPLVENSIIHGMEKGNGSGTIHIGIELADELVIRVMDNGKGMSPENIDRLMQEYEGRRQPASGEHGIGLINVMTRLRLRYDGDFSWDMESVPFEATVITLRIRQEQPKMSVGTDEDKEGRHEGVDRG